jgi:very-short-patch-repair endonuclease
MKVAKLSQKSTNSVLFKEKAREIYGEIHKESFDMQMFHYLYDIGISSPIEEIFFMALHLQCAELDHEFTTDEIKERKGFKFTLAVVPQKQIGKYRVDFLIQLAQGKEIRELIVELDGHDFHEKNKHQRSYEKARDRFLIQSGYMVFHYTGSDVVSKPHHIAYEVMKSLGSIFCKSETVEEHDPDNLLGWANA